jgi:hypothetical protein
LFSRDRRSLGTLIDESTGARRQIVSQGCDLNRVLGGPWLAVDCGYVPSRDPRTVRLYSLVEGAWRTVEVDPRIANCSCLELVGVGAHWLEFRQSTYHPPDRYFFQSLDSGDLRGDPTRRSIIPDLNAPGLARRLCAPVHVPRGPASGTYEPTLVFGSILFAGRFALAFAGPLDAGPLVYLEQCGSPLHELLCRDYCQVHANTRLVVWLPYDDGRQLRGILLRSRQRVRIPLPKPRAGTSYAVVALSGRRLYVTTSTGQLLTTRLPG